MSRLDFFGTICYYVLIRIKTPLFDVCVRLKGHYMDTLIDRIDAIDACISIDTTHNVAKKETANQLKQH